MATNNLKPIKTAPKDWRQRWHDILGKISIVENDADLESLLESFVAGEAPKVLAFVNAHAMNTLADSAPFHEALAAADIILRDGSGMATLYRMLGKSAGLNLNGTDLIPRIIKRFDGQKIALLGTQEPFLTQAREKALEALAPASIITTDNGFLPAQTYIDIAKAQRPALIVLGMGMPKQEQVAVQLRSALDYPCLIVCGGAIIDFLGGKVARAPVLLRHIGMEWVYRLLLEPRRLFQRYVIGNPRFLLAARHYRRTLGNASH